MAPAAAAAQGGQQASRRPRSRHHAQARIGYLFSSGYAFLLLAFGVGPMVYALYLAFTQGGEFVGFDNFSNVFGDFRFWPAVGHVAAYLAVWLVSLMVLVVLLALIVHSIRVRWMSSATRFLFYIPGALAGAASVMLWLFVLDPSVSPLAVVLEQFGFTNFTQTVALANLPVIFTVIAFWTGAGGWIIVMYGALNTISVEVMEAARIDGAGAVKTALYIQIPLLRKWIAYMAVISLAAGTQLFVEPKILSLASRGVVPRDYSLNQLAYIIAFGPQADFNGSAAISIMLLVVATGLSAFFVLRGGLFERA
jgi:multiple sugar transport system permease protein